MTWAGITTARRREAAPAGPRQLPVLDGIRRSHVPEMEANGQGSAFVKIGRRSG
jgi:hypothetical protein